MNIEDYILYEDKEIIGCQKPAGMAVQTARMGQMDMESALKNYLAQRTGDGRAPYLGIIHRLDQPVAGVLVFAKTPQAAKELSRQITDHTMEKYYHAVICGHAPQKEGTLVDYLLKDGRTNTSKVVPKGTKGAKEAVLHYRVCEERDAQGREILEIHLITGRHHQIRVQLSHAGIPLVGDYKYNPVQTAEGPRESMGLEAFRLEFTHPKTKKRICLTPKSAL
ncbi:MAG: RluA family pseudouridine synthase [Lachnospiraceae bacterium]|nr:RluA family pseudouridine synthase [Lachnospiraceae bacterium]